MPRISKSDEERLSDWKERLKMAAWYRQKYGRDDQWPRYRGLMRPYYRKDKMLRFNLCIAVEKALEPLVYFRNPKVTILAKKPGLEDAARVREAIANALIEKLRIKDVIRQMIRLAFRYGTGTCKFGFDRQHGLASEGTKESLDRGQPEQVVKKAGTRGEYKYIEHHRNIELGMPWCLASHTVNVLAPYGAVDAESLPWVAWRVYRGLDDVLADDLYKNKSELKTTHKVAPTTGTEEGDYDTPADMSLFHYPEERDKQKTGYVELWEIHDLETRHVMVLSKDHDKWLRDDDDELQTDGLPADFLIFNPDDMVFWGLPDLALLEPLQTHLDDVATMFNYAVKTSIPKWLLKQEALEKEEDFTSPVLRQIVRVMGEGGIDQIAKEVRGSIPGDYLMVIDYLWQKGLQMVGLTPEALAQTTEKTHIPAARTYAAREGQQMRGFERRDLCADLLIRIVRQLLSIAHRFWDSERAFEIVGADGYPHWVSVKGVDLEDDTEFSYAVEAESAAPYTQELRKQEAIAMFQAFGPSQAQPQGDPFIDQFLLREYVLRQAQGIDIERLMGPGRRLQAAQQGGSPQTPMSFEEFRGLQPVMPAEMPAAMPPGVPAEMMGA